MRINKTAIILNRQNIDFIRKIYEIREDAQHPYSICGQAMIDEYQMRKVAGKDFNP